jgi:hypothetical protein
MPALQIQAVLQPFQAAIATKLVISVVLAAVPSGGAVRPTGPVQAMRGVYASN